MVITVVNIMLARVTVLKNYCLSAKLHFVVLLFVFDLRWLITRKLFIIIDFAARLEFESFKCFYLILHMSIQWKVSWKWVFFQEVRVNEFALI